MSINGKTAKYYIGTDGGSQVVFAGPETGDVKRSGCYGKRSALEVALIIISVVSTCVAVSLIVVLLVRGNNDTNSSQLSDAESSTSGSSQSVHTLSSSSLDPTTSVSTNMGNETSPTFTTTTTSTSSASSSGSQATTSSPSTKATNTSKGTKAQEDVDLETSAANATLQLSKGNTVMKDGIEICLDPDCVKASARFMSSMNTHVDPCDDFFEYACGTWNKLNVIPQDKGRYNTFSKLRDDLQILLKELLEVHILPDEQEATKQAKYLYQSCVNETQIESRGLELLISLLDELGGWPVVGGWDASNFDINKLLALMPLYNEDSAFIQFMVFADPKESDVNIIQIDQPNLGMLSRDYYLKGRDDPVILAYESFAVQVAMFLGADEERAKKEVEELVDLEIQLANITTPQDQRRDSELLYNKMTVQELSGNFTGFDWKRYMNLLFQEVNITLDNSEEVVVYAPEYLTKLMDILEVTDNRTIANYLIWRIMMNRVNNLPKKYRSVQKEFKKVLSGTTAEKARWRDCVIFVNENMGNAVGRLFVEAHFDEDAKHNALEMISHIRHSFYELLEEVPWMNNETRKVAKDKAEAITEKIGFPEYIKNDTALDESLGDLQFDPNKYFENILANIKSIAKNNMMKLREPVDKTRWSSTPAVVNAFYSAPKNQITFPAGILQPPFYSKGYPKFINYGGIGAVIGHEITHGFDDQGRQFDKDGNLKQWWSNEVIERFKGAAQCIVDQYSNFTLEEIGMNLNGVQTQGENIADNGGLKEAYRAYSNWVTNERGGVEEARLPGLEKFTPRQLFFMNFAQVWCGTMRPQEAINSVHTAGHSPGIFRVIGTLRNSHDFAEAFHCPVGSPMNPVNKCRVW